MLADVLSSLLCPFCKGALSLCPPQVGCELGHRFDVARQGYLNLHGAPAKPFTGDDAAMVNARAAFLDAGHYAPIADAIARHAIAMTPMDDGLLVDVGAGTGYYLQSLLTHMTDAFAIAVDASKYALRRAARCHPRVTAVAANAWQGLPIQSGTASAILNVFAPRNGGEFRRILKQDGALITVTPRPDHLHEVVTGLELLSVDDQKSLRVARSLGNDFTLVKQESTRFPIALEKADSLTLAGMGPSARHTDPGSLLARADHLEYPINVTVSVDISIFRAG